MTDPCTKSNNFSRSYQVYAEKHRIYEVFQEVLKELLIYKPEYPIQFMSEQFVRIANGIDSPRTLLLGPDEITTKLGKKLASKTGAIFLTFHDIIDESPIRKHLKYFIHEGPNNDDEEDEEALNLKQVLVNTINHRLGMDDCVENGYILFGFPRNKAQAVMSQKAGLLPRQVLILEPDTYLIQESANDLGASFYRAKSTGRVSVKKYESGIGIPQESSEIGKKFEDYSRFVLAKNNKGKSKPRMNQEFLNVRDIQSAYSPEICKVYRHSFWTSLEKSNLEMELYSALITKRSKGVPLIPKILLIGYPGAGKSKYADYIESKFNVVNVNWREVIRANSLYDDETGEEAREYLKHGTDFSAQTVAKLLEKALGREDASKKGWVLTGFPENEEQMEILDQLSFTPNRIFFISIPEDLSRQRMLLKGEDILSRGFTWEGKHISGDRSKSVREKFPYTEEQINSTIGKFVDNLPKLIIHYGNSWIMIDGSQAEDDIKEYMEASIICPQTIKFGRTY